MLETKNMEDDPVIQEVTPILQKVIAVLSKKAMHEMKRQDKENKTTLGNCAFWFEFNHEFNGYALNFSKHPSLWRLDDIINEAEALEKQLLKDEGIQFFEDTEFF